MAKAKPRPPAKCLKVRVDDRGEWCFVAVEPDGTERPATPEEITAAHREVEASILEGQAASREIWQTITTEPDWKPPARPGANRYRFYRWLAGLDPGYHPTLGESFLGAAVAARRVCPPVGQGKLEPEKSAPPDESLGKVESAVVQALLQSKPKVLVYPDLAEQAGYSIREIGEAVRSLEGRGLAHRPCGSKSGVTLTARGEGLAHRLLDG